MEELLHYVWKHKLLPLGGLHTTDGSVVDVIDPGLHNRNAGPDFFNAKVRIGGTLWVGNVEIHQRSSDWYAHGHDLDARYNNVILHITGMADADVRTEDGRYLPQAVLQVPQEVESHYRELLSTDHYPPCYKIIPTLRPLLIHSWMAALQTERLEQKTQAIKQRALQSDGSWEDAYFQTLARNFGFGINGDAFEQWARCVPLNAVGKHRDNLFQVEAIFMGQAGLLSLDSMPQRHREAAQADSYFNSLANEYKYLAHKFSMTPMDSVLWRFLRLRPQNFPHIRISQLAMLYHERRSGLSELLECRSVDELAKLFSTHVSPYWESHYTFGSESKKSTKQLSEASIRLLVINTAIPMSFAMGRHKQKEELCDRAFDLLEQMKAEKNHIITMWQQCGLTVGNAGDSQALIQLKKEYCDRRDCLRCRFGYEYLRANTQNE